jgi:hypothetical protein
MGKSNALVNCNGYVPARALQHTATMATNNHSLFCNIIAEVSLL